jgi:hypothetical protein
MFVVLLFHVFGMLMTIVKVVLVVVV